MPDQALPSLAEGFSWRQNPSGLAYIDADTPLCRASICLQGAQVVSFQAQGRPPLLWLSPAVVLAPGKAIRGGVPLCWPWFGPDRSGRSLPQHGFARTRAWNVLGSGSAAEGALRLSLGLTDDGATRSQWPHAFSLRLDLLLGRELDLHLTATNTGDSPWPWQAAFHPYLSVPGIVGCRLQGLGGLSYRDVTQGPGLQVQAEDALAVDRALDRVYQGSPDACTLHDAAGTTVFRFTKRSARDTVVWNPGPRPVSSPPDLPLESWADFLCVEALSRDEPVELAPGAAAALGMRLTN